MILKFFLSHGLLVSGTYILATLLVAQEIGYRLGRWLTRGEDDAVFERIGKGVGTITSAILALVAFTMATSISMADRRFEERRKLVLQEANAIDTARLHARGIGGPHGEEIVRLLADYTQIRIDSHFAGEDQRRLEAFHEKTAVLQQRIWAQASDLVSLTPTPVAAALWRSVTEVFDLASARRWAFEVRVPFQVFNFLHFTSLLAAGIIGYYFSLSRHRHFVLSSLLLFSFTATMLLIFDLDKPRSGGILVEQAPLMRTLDLLKGKLR